MIVHATHEQRSRRGAGDLRVEPGEARARVGRCVEVRCVDLAAEGADVAVAQIVGDDHEDVRSRRARRAHSVVVGTARTGAKQTEGEESPTIAMDELLRALDDGFCREQRWPSITREPSRKSGGGSSKGTSSSSMRCARWRRNASTGIENVLGQGRYACVRVLDCVERSDPSRPTLVGQLVAAIASLRAFEEFHVRVVCQVLCDRFR